MDREGQRYMLLDNMPSLKRIFYLVTSFARRKATRRIWQHDWLKLVGEKIRRKQLGTVLKQHIQVWDLPNTAHLIINVGN